MNFFKLRLLSIFSPFIIVSLIATPVLANEAWLVLTQGVFGSKLTKSAANSDSTSTVTIPMKTMMGCMIEGQQWAELPTKFRKGFREFLCIENL